MASLLYFVPRVQTPNQAEKALRDAGAAHVLEGPVSKAAMPKPPDGAGYLMVPLPEPPGIQATVFYTPDEQEWSAVAGADDRPGYWIGREKTRPPCPEDLARPKQLPGHKVELADGGRWLVPVARYLSGASGFPQKLKRAGDTWELGEVLDRYSELWTHACRAWDEFSAAAEGGGGELTITDGADIVVAALALNYRLGPEEVSFLGLLDTHSTMQALLALVDWPSLTPLLKKTEAAGSSTTDGDPE